MPDLRSLLDELKRRKVVRTAGLYAVVAWIVVEVASVVLPALRLPEWTLTFVVVALSKDDVERIAQARVHPSRGEE